MHHETVVTKVANLKPDVVLLLQREQLQQQITFFKTYTRTQQTTE